MVAKSFLARREGEIAGGKTPSINFEKVTFNEVSEIFLRDYKINQKKTIGKAEMIVKRLKTSFENMSVPGIITPKINAYVEGRINEGAANATINRELAALKRMLNLGAKQTPPMVDRVPHIPLLEECNARKGFFEHSDFLAMRDALPEYLKGIVTFGYKSGWRISEITGLTWSNVDLENKIVSLDTGTTKNKEGRTLYLDDELAELLIRQRMKQKVDKVILPYVFPNKKRTGQIIDFRGSWKKACNKVGLPGHIFHDLRRTAVRNMVRAGVPERVTMMISGHKTRAVFDRYNIVNEDDLMRAAKQQEVYLKNQLGTNSGTITQLGQK